MKTRTIKRIVSAQRINMGGHLLDQPLPVNGIDSIDPFLLIHHWDEPLKPGVGITVLQNRIVQASHSWTR